VRQTLEKMVDWRNVFLVKMIELDSLGISQSEWVSSVFFVISSELSFWQSPLAYLLDTSGAKWRKSLEKLRLTRKTRYCAHFSLSLENKTALRVLSKVWSFVEFVRSSRSSFTTEVVSKWRICRLSRTVLLWVNNIIDYYIIYWIQAIFSVKCYCLQSFTK